ncbi:MAG: hypothetical protein AB7G28_02180 [Pirellulales bacterium]
MTTFHADTEHDLKPALEQFENCLIAPVMAGELLNWTSEVQAAWCDCVAQVREHLRELHPRQYKQISKEDPELLPRTEKLQDADANLEEDCEEFERTLHRFAEHAPKFEPDEEKISSHVRSLVDGGVALVTSIRKQEAAVQAWFVEAFNRDRGVGD